MINLNHTIITQIIVVTVVSAYMKLELNFEIETIPEIDAGFDGIPRMPRFDILPKMYSSAILIAFVSFISTFSLGKMFANEHGYQISANQELLALGAANTLSAFFLCYPCSGSLSRSAVQNKVGGRTQLASVVSCAFLVVFILYFSTYLETLPKVRLFLNEIFKIIIFCFLIYLSIQCVLSCLIIVALYGTMKQFMEFFKYWKFSKVDGVSSFFVDS